MARNRQQFLSAEHCQSALERQHTAFMLVHKRTKEAKRRQAKYAEKILNSSI